LEEQRAIVNFFQKKKNKTKQKKRIIPIQCKQKTTTKKVLYPFAISELRGKTNVSERRKQYYMFPSYLIKKKKNRQNLFFDVVYIELIFLIYLFINYIDTKVVFRSTKKIFSQFCNSYKSSLNNFW
jgi:hypothetical protein